MMSERPTPSGEMPERSKGVDSKSTVRSSYRGFESLSLRHKPSQRQPIVARQPGNGDSEKMAGIVRLHVVIQRFLGGTP